MVGLTVWWPDEPAQSGTSSTIDTVILCAVPFWNSGLTKDFDEHF
jgi:hypothetical protein